MALKEVKTIRNKESVCAYALTCALILVFLLSSTVRTIVSAKPDRPGKPAEKWDLSIWIGLKDSEGNPVEDIVLVMPDYLFAEEVPCSGGLWATPVGKGIKSYVSAQATLYRWFENGVWNGAETCGTYYLAHAEGQSSAGEPTYLDEFHHAEPGYTVIEVSVGHQISQLGQNYWWFRLQWLEGPPFDENSDRYCLEAWTSKDGIEEGQYPEENVLSVVFNGAEAMIYSSWDYADGDGVPDTFDWKGAVSFTVKIIRSPSVP